MKLEYRILWFEDQPQSISPMRQNIQDELEYLGFAPVIDLRIVDSSSDPLVDLPDQRDIDLVLMDWKLGEHDGADLSQRVRLVFRYTDIVFYSAESTATLRRLIFEKGIDGVHCCHRMNLTEGTLGIIKTQMHKVLDLNHMRGIVMATVSDLEHTVIECLKLVQPLAYPGGAEKFAASISEKVIIELKKKVEEIEQFGKKGKLQKLLTSPHFNAKLRLDALQEVLQTLGVVEHGPHLEKLGTFLDDVITPRNDLAHRPAVVIGGELRLEGRPTPFTQESMIELRLRLLSHVENLQGLLKLLRPAV